MSNGYLCIGGAADGQYHTVPSRIEQGAVIETYIAFHWHQGEHGTIAQRTRYYLIPPHWDGFEAMDYLERKAYGDDSR